MPYFLTLQAHYTNFEVGIFSDNTLLSYYTDDKKYASRDLVPIIQSILTKNKINVTDLDGIIVNKGPAPFTSLRVIITTANGLSFADNVPLIGVNGLEALLLEHKNLAWPITVALLNAFNNDVYYGIDAHDAIEIGCENGEHFLLALKERYKNRSIRFIGNGAQLFIQQIKATFGTQAFIQEPFVDAPSLQIITHKGIEMFEQKQYIQSPLLPLYLKNIRYTPAI